MNIPIRAMSKNVDKSPAKDAAIVTVCKSGMRRADMVTTFSILGWTNVKDMAFGMPQWEKQGFAVVK